METSVFDAFENLETLVHEQKTQIRSQELEIIELKATIEQLQNSTLVMQSKIESLESNLRSILSGQVLSLIDFTSYTLENPNGTLQVSTKKIEWSKADRTVHFYLVSGEQETQIKDFVHRFSFSFSEIEAGDQNQRGIGGIWKVTTEESLPTYNSLSIWCEQRGDIDDEYYLYFAQKFDDNLIFIENMGIFEAGEDLYLEVSRTDDQCRLKIFEDRCYLVSTHDSGNQVGSDLPYDYIGLGGHRMREVDSGDWTSGYIAGLQVFPDPN